MEYLNTIVGKKGEELACQFLIKSGYEIITRNYYDRVGEIDVIAFKDYTIHFIEVKSVSCETWGGVIRETEYNPAEKVDKRKMRRIEKTAEMFLFENSLEEESYQFDLVVMKIFDGGFRYEIEFIQNINID